MRPQLHLTADGWVNDPLGLTWHEGRYHLFFQHVPGSTAWDVGCHWGHATSTDLLHWTPEPVALAPGDGEDGIWSGCLVVPDGGDPVLLYTAVDDADHDDGRVRVATPDPDWRTWHKGEVLLRRPEGLGLTAFRDPWVVRDGDRWRMTMAAGLSDGRGAVVGYRSTDLRDWHPDGLLAVRGADEDTGSVWECPQLVRVDGAWVLLISVWRDGELDHVAWSVGDLGEVFVARASGRLTWGTCYAGSVFTDADGEIGLITWLREVRGEDWTGALSVPWRLRVVDGEVRAEPHPALLGALGDPRRPEAVAVDRGGSDPDGAQVPAADPVLALWSPLDGGVLTTGQARVHAHAGGSGAHDELAVTAPAGRWQVPWRGSPVLVLVDGPVLELLVEGHPVGLPLGEPSGWLRVDGPGTLAVARDLGP